MGGSLPLQTELRPEGVPSAVALGRPEPLLSAWSFHKPCSTSVCGAAPGAWTVADGRAQPRPLGRITIQMSQQGPKVTLETVTSARK